MDYHHHARLTVHGREALARSVVEGRLSLCEAAAEHRLSRQSAGKWVRRYREGGVDHLRDRSSRPARLRQPTSAEQVMRVEALRRERRTGVQIAQATGLSRATVSRILVRLKLNRIGMLELAEPVVRYGHAAPGDLLHIDIKKLARIVKPGHRITGDPRDETRGAGWEFLYVAIDDHSRLAFTAMYPNEKAASSIDFLQRATAWFASFDIHIRGVLTDNPGSPESLLSGVATALASTGFSSAVRANASTSAIAAHGRTARKPMAKPNASSRQPCASGPTPDVTKPQPKGSIISNHGLHQYNWYRPHASLNQSPPISRSGVDDNNLLRHHS